MILSDFYNNGIYPFEDIVPRDPEYRELGRKISAEHEYLESILSPEDAKRLENYCTLMTDRAVMDCRESLIYGFRLAVLMMIDVFHIPGK